MLKNTVLATAFAAAFAAAAPICAHAADDKELAAIRAEMKQMKDAYEARMLALEQRLQSVQDTAQAKSANAPVAPSPAPASASANAFNPAISLILGATMRNLSQDPAAYRFQGFIPPAGEIGPGNRSFNLGESELTLKANIDPQFSGQLTFALEGENSVSVEEAFVQTRALSNGVNFKAGRFLSSLGYLNNHHAHTWDFVDAPLAYQAFFGGQFKADGLQAKWLAPSERFIELGMELGGGASFPGNQRSKNGFGAGALFAHLGDDIGDAASWRAGLSFFRSGAENRDFQDGLNNTNNSFSGKSTIWIADAVYKWAPNGNSTYSNVKLQGEYFRRRENGSLSHDIDGSGSPALAGGFSSTQSGWYLQGVYQFMPMWRAGLRYDRLTSGSPGIGLQDKDGLPSLASFNPARGSLMFDYTPSEFSRFRLQMARDTTRPGVVDHQIFLQYIMSLGAHGAHAF